jgi:diguanylate cyclase (GGDEF)-like protein
MYRRFIPSILFTLALAGLPFVLLSVENKRVALYDLVFAAPYLMLILVGFLGERLNQRRVLFTAIVLALSSAYLCFDLPAALAPHVRGAKGQILSIALPLMLFACFALKEIWLRRMQGLLVLIGVITPLIACDALYSNNSFAWLFGGRVHEGLFFVHLSNASIFLGMLFAGLAHQTEDRYLRSFRYFLAAALLPLFYVFERTGMRMRTLHHFQLEVSLSFLSAAAVLVYACFYLYWQKVYLDELTGIPNRRALNERLSVLRNTYAIAMIDIDHFKRFNDSYGHEQGDGVLRLVASHFSSPEHGQIYRYGGEEFCIIFEGIGVQHAADICEGLRERLSRRDFFIRPSRKGQPKRAIRGRGRGNAVAIKLHVTVSIGVAEPTDAHHRPEDILSVADQRLYRAKQTGRNKVAQG